MLPPARLLFAATSAALAGLAPAQSVESRGVLAGSPTTVFVDGPSPSGATDGTTLVHPNGFAQTAPLEFGAFANAPDLRAILTAHGAPLTVDVDDHSTGRDDLLIDADGFLTATATEWSVWSFSLRDGAVGQPGSRIAQQSAEGDVGATLFSYVLPGSGLPSELVGRTERSHSRADLGLAGTTGVEVDGIDLPLMLGMDQSLAFAGGMPVLEPGFATPPGPMSIYFTVSHATRGLVPVPWWAGTPPSGATILCTSQASVGGWTQPTVFATFLDLGLDQDEDIDALAIEANLERVLFSVVGTARDQFLYYDLSTDGAPTDPKVVKTNDGTPVSQQVGKAQNDDIDAVCTLDPNLESSGMPPLGGDDFGSSCGEPRDGLLGVPELSGSAFRRFEGGQTRFDSWLVGWPSATGAVPSLAAAFLTSGNNLDPVLISVHLRDPLDPIAGNPVSTSLVVPAALTMTSLPFSIRWFHLDVNNASVAEAWPVQIYL